MEIITGRQGPPGPQGPEGPSGLGIKLPPILVDDDIILTEDDTGNTYFYRSVLNTYQITLPPVNAYPTLVFAMFVYGGDSMADIGLLIKPDGDDTINLGNVETTIGTGNIKSTVKGSMIIFYNIEGEGTWFTQPIGQWDFDV